MRYLRLLRLFAQIELQFALEYRANLVLDLLEEVIIVVTSLAAVLVLLGRSWVRWRWGSSWPVWASRKSASGSAPAEAASFLVTLACGLLLVYGLLLVPSTLSFWNVLSIRPRDVQNRSPRYVRNDVRHGA